MFEKIKYNVFVFFAKRRTIKRLKELNQELNALSWHIGVEKNNDEKLWQRFEEVKTLIFIKETTLKGLVYA